MGCGSCSSGGGCSPAGCGKQGSCVSGSCNKVNVFDWLNDVDTPLGMRMFDVVEIRFKGTRKEYFRNVNDLELFMGDYVAVEAATGHDVGQVSLKGELVRLQLKKNKITEEDPEIRKIYRLASESDLQKYQEAKDKELEILFKSRETIQKFGLDMKLGDIEVQSDKSKITFYYTAEGRVDFRELIKSLAEEFKCRIEMRQIGARQEAGRIGGIGSCGRELCCSTWLTDFKSVTTGAARYQNLSLNPLKLAGQCGRLKCCLNYELNTYLDALKDFPKDIKSLKSKNAVAEVIKTDIFKRQFWFLVPNDRDAQPFALPVERVIELSEMNKRGEFPDSFEDEALKYADVVVEDDEPDFETVEGGGLNRFEKKAQKKKKKLGQGSVDNRQPNPVNQPRTDNRPPNPRPPQERPQGNRNAPENRGPQQPRPAQTRPQAEVKPAEGGVENKVPVHKNQNPNQRRPNPTKPQGSASAAQSSAEGAPKVPVHKNQNPNQNPNQPKPKPAAENPTGAATEGTATPPQQNAGGNKPNPNKNRNFNKNRRPPNSSGEAKPE